MEKAAVGLDHWGAALAPPLAVAAGLASGLALDYGRRIDLVDRQIFLHAWGFALFQPIAGDLVAARHLREGRDVLLVVEAVEIGLHLAWGVCFFPINITHRSPLLRGGARAPPPRDYTAF